MRLSDPSTYEPLQRPEDMLLALKPIPAIIGDWLRPGTCGQDCGIALASGPTGWAGNSQGVALLVFLLALSFGSWSVLAAQLHLGGDPDSERPG